MHIFRTLSSTVFAAVSTAVLLASSPASALTITVNSSSSCTSSVDGVGNVTINCSGGGGGPSCSVGGGGTLTSSGGNVSFTATNCGTGSWTSTRPGFPGCSAATCSDSVPANTSSSSQTYTYTYTGSTGSGSATVIESGTGSDTTPGNISCTSIPGINNTRVVAMPWQFTSGIISTAKLGGFKSGDAYVFTITPPPGTTTSGQLGSFSTAPTDGNGYNNRIISLSDTPCDFSRKLGRGSVVQGMVLTAYFTVGGYPIDKYGRQDTTYPSLTPGQTYYVTVIQQNSVGGSNSCLNSSCNINYGLSPGT